MLFGDNRKADNVTGRVIESREQNQGDTVPISGFGLREFGAVSL